jgi:primary-amine oxidase
VIALALGLTASLGARGAAADASAYCRGEQLAVGASWSVCWEVRANEGLAITHAFYTREGFDRRVLSDATVAQIFVPYETGQPRYHDVAYGLGLFMQPLDGSIDCPDGTLLASGKVCRVIEDRGLAERTCTGGACASRRGEALVLWSSSQMGAYHYITEWAFHDDGAIEPSVALGGALQFGDTAHVHNVYWRLDLDIDGPEGDHAEEFYRIPPATSDGSTGTSGWVPLLGETYRPTDLSTFRKWRVRDDAGTNERGRSWSYELVPTPGDGNLRTTPAEGFTRGELWVTRAKPDERFVSTDTADLLSGYLDGDDVAGQDVVLWYAMHKYHEVRSEDRPVMPIEWMGFALQPRDFFDANPRYQ